MVSLYCEDSVGEEDKRPQTNGVATWCCNGYILYTVNCELHDWERQMEETEEKGSSVHERLKSEGVKTKEV